MNNQVSNALVPMVVEREANGERAYDIFSRTLKDRIIFLNGQVEDNMASLIVAQLLYLDNLSKDDIFLYINSPGGVVTAGMAIIDTMNFIKSDVVTLSLGQACSMGSMILTQGAKGKRFSLPNTSIMFHQPSGGARGMASDIEIQAEEIKRLKRKLNQMIVDATGRTYEEVEAIMDRDTWMTPERALEFGAIDRIIKSANDIAPSGNSI